MAINLSTVRQSLRKPLLCCGSLLPGFGDVSPYVCYYF